MARSTSVTCSVQVLPTRVLTGVSAASSVRSSASSSAGTPFAAGAGERGQPGVLSAEVRGRPRRTPRPWGWSRASRPRCSGRRLIQLAGDAELVLEGEGDALALRAVPQRGIVDRDGWFCGRLAHFLILLQAQFALDFLQGDRGRFPTTLVEERHEFLFWRVRWISSSKSSLVSKNSVPSVARSIRSLSCRSWSNPRRWQQRGSLAL